ncbi:hypothetical protein [Xanthomonas phage RTH11]|nr:hypothetical protein [Xanthomonas phage RTH11]
MSNLSRISSLSRTALEAVQNLFLAVFTRSIDTRFVDFSLDRQNSELIITSKEESESGEVGIYRGAYRWPYNKASLNTSVPFPLAVQVEYPLTFRALRAQLLARYEILLEENEFAMTLGGTPLVDDSLLDQPLLMEFGQFKLYATSSSGRFVAGTYLTLVFVQPNKRISLRSLFDTTKTDLLGSLAPA